MSAMPMAEVLGFHAAEGPTRVAIVCDGRSVTYGELDDASTGLAERMRNQGVDAGCIVAILVPNSIDFFIAAFAAWKAGATPLPLSAGLARTERAEMLRLARPSLVVALQVADACGWPTLHPHAQGDRTPIGVPPSGQPWKAIGSGGSTGRPKVIMAGLPAMVDPDVPRYRVERGDIVLIPGPLYHQGPFIFATSGLFLGNTIVVMGRFDARESLALIERHRISWVYFVPTMMHRIWRLGQDARSSHDLSSLRLVVSTGAPWPWWLKKSWIDWLGPRRILEMYGGTEEQGGLEITGTESLEHPGAIGAAGSTVRVVRSDGGDAAEGEVGELVFRARETGNHSCIGAVAEDTGGWRSYGDLARIVDGYVYLADRRTDLVVTGGVNVYPAEIEGALESHPSVRSAAVIGLPDDDLGQRVHAVVDVGGESGAGGTPPDAGGLADYLRTRLSGAKIPRTFEFVSEPLRDDAGKLRRSALRQART